MEADKYIQRCGKQYLKCRYCNHFNMKYERCNLFDVWVKPDIDGCTDDYIKACEQIQQNS